MSGRNLIFLFQQTSSLIFTFVNTCVNAAIIIIIITDSSSTSIKLFILLSQFQQQPILMATLGPPAPSHLESPYNENVLCSQVSATNFYLRLQQLKNSCLFQRHIEAVFSAKRYKFLITELCCCRKASNIQDKSKTSWHQIRLKPHQTKLEQTKRTKEWNIISITSAL